MLTALDHPFLFFVPCELALFPQLSELPGVGPWRPFSCLMQPGPVPCWNARWRDEKQNVGSQGWVLTNWALLWFPPEPHGHLGAGLWSSDSAPPCSPGRSWVRLTPPSCPYSSSFTTTVGDTRALPYLGENGSKVQVWTVEAPASSPQVRPFFPTLTPACQASRFLSRVTSWPWGLGPSSWASPIDLKLL